MNIEDIETEPRFRIADRFEIFLNPLRIVIAPFGQWDHTWLLIVPRRKNPIFIRQRGFVHLWK